MLLYLAIGVAFGLLIGVVIAWALGRGHRQEQKHRSAALEATQQALEAERRQWAGREKEWNERAASQREEIARIGAECSASEQNAERAASALEDLRTANDRLRNDLAQSQTDLATLRATLEGERKNAQEKLEMLAAARVELSNQFEALANKILEEKTKRFTEQNQTNIGNLLNPLKEKFGEFQQKVESLEKENLTGRTELKTQIEQLRGLNERLSQDANNLVTALKGSSKTQGQWGEQLLETILEDAGLRKGHEYFTQESFTRTERAADGHKRAQLDVLVRLPENRNLVIDSKVSLIAYDEYSKAQEDASREAALGRHIASVRGHINELARRDYHLLEDINSPDFVVMFMPLEPAFMLAIARDSRLWQDAWDKNILLVSPSTLLFVLRTVAQLWRQEQQTKNVQEIVRRGGELYNKLAGFAEDLTTVGKSLDAARASYAEAYKKLATGKGNAIRQAEMLKGLGVKPSKTIPIALVEQATEQEPLELAAGESED